MSKATQPVAVDGIEFDALISSDEGHTAEIPDYPIETGFMVSDTITIQPMTLSMTLFLTDTPVTWRSRFGGGQGRSDQVIDQLKRTYEKRELVTVVTSEQTYENMGIESYTISKSLDIGYAYQIPISFKQVKKTQTKTVGIPASYGKSGKTGTNAGKASTSSGGGGSILYNSSQPGGLLSGLMGG